MRGHADSLSCLGWTPRPRLGAARSSRRAAREVSWTFPAAPPKAAEAARPRRDAGRDARHDAPKDAPPDVPMNVPPPFNCVEAGITYVYLMTDSNDLLAFYPPDRPDGDQPREDRLPGERLDAVLDGGRSARGSRTSCSRRAASLFRVSTGDPNLVRSDARSQPDQHGFHDVRDGLLERRRRARRDALRRADRRAAHAAVEGPRQDRRRHLPARLHRPVLARTSATRWR